MKSKGLHNSSDFPTSKEISLVWVYFLNDSLVRTLGPTLFLKELQQFSKLSRHSASMYVIEWWSKLLVTYVFLGVLHISIHTHLGPWESLGFFSRTYLHILQNIFNSTMRTNLPKLLDLLIFCIYVFTKH